MAAFGNYLNLVLCLLESFLFFGLYSAWSQLSLNFKNIGMFASYCKNLTDDPQEMVNRLNRREKTFKNAGHRSNKIYI